MLRSKKRQVAEDEEKAKLAEASIPEVTSTQLETLGERFDDKRVKLTHIKFGRADNLWVESLPGVTISTNGLLSTIDTKAAQQWIGFSIFDNNGRSFGRCFAPKETYADLIAGMKKGTEISLRGYVVAMEGSELYGVVCYKIDVDVPEARQDAP